MLTAWEAREQLAEQHGMAINRWLGTIDEEIGKAVGRGESFLLFDLLGVTTPGFNYILKCVVKELTDNGYRVKRQSPNHLIVRWD